MNEAVCEVKVIGFNIQKKTTYRFLLSKELPPEITIEPFIGTLEKDSEKISVLIINYLMDDI